MSSKHLFAINIAALISTAVTSCVAVAENPNHKYMGTGSCSSSNCHGNVNALDASSVLQNEYHTWLKRDRHSKAYSVLTNEDSKRIGMHLGMADPSKEPLCLKCHATYVADPDQHGPKYQLEDGVSCESCHGAAEKWLQSHSVSGATHAENVKNGLSDITPLDKRATLCLSCHYGNDEKTVNHDLYGAGHPRLSFELDTFGILQPKHWVIDEDYVKRKAAYVPVVAWMSGQAMQSRAVLDALESPKRSKNGAFPELALFDCNSCHHSLTEDQWKSRTYGGRPGELNINIPSLFVLRDALTAVDSSLASEFSARLKELHDNYKNDGGRRSIPALRDLIDNRVTPAVAKLDSSPKMCAAILKQLSRAAAATPWPKYEVAEQFGMAMQAVLASAPELGKTYKADIDAMFATLKSSEAFAPQAFTDAARKLSGRI